MTMFVKNWIFTVDDQNNPVYINLAHVQRVRPDDNIIVFDKDNYIRVENGVGDEIHDYLLGYIDDEEIK